MDVSVWRDVCGWSGQGQNFMVQLSYGHKIINWLKCPCSALVKLHCIDSAPLKSTAQHRWSEMHRASNFVIRVFTGINGQISYILGWIAPGGYWKFFAAYNFRWQTALIVHSLKNYLPASYRSRHRMFAGTTQHLWHRSGPQGLSGVTLVENPTPVTDNDPKKK
jgi:hypothetical protein